MSHDPGSDRLHAFVDGQLGAADRARLLDEMGADPDLRRQVCELRQVKEYMLCAFEEPPPPPIRRRKSDTRWIARGAAALLLLCAGFLAGRWSDPGFAPAPPMRSHVVIHLDSEEQGRLLRALADAEALAGRQGDDVQVEVVTNGGGLALISDGSPLAGEVRSLMGRHRNLQFIACNLAIRKQRALGREVVLMEGVHVAPSAGDYILGRLSQGWSYVRV